MNHLIAQSTDNRKRSCSSTSEIRENLGFDKININDFNDSQITGMPMASWAFKNEFGPSGTHSLFYFYFWQLESKVWIKSFYFVYYITWDPLTTIYSKNSSAIRFNASLTSKSPRAKEICSTSSRKPYLINHRHPYGADSSSA